MTRKEFTPKEMEDILNLRKIGKRSPRGIAGELFNSQYETAIIEFLKEQGDSFDGSTKQKKEKKTVVLPEKIQVDQQEKISKEEKDRIKAVYLNGDSLTYTASQVSKEFKKHVSSGDVRKVLIELKVEIRPTGGQKGKKIYRGTVSTRKKRKSN